METKYEGVEGIKVSKSGNMYVNNAVFYEEMKKSLEQDELTDAALKMMILISEGVNKKKHYANSDDRDDCIAGSIMDCVTYWRGFDPTKTTNPFAYFTSVATNGMAKMWRTLGKMKCPDSMKISIDNEKIHSI